MSASSLAPPRGCAISESVVGYGRQGGCPNKFCEPYRYSRKTAAAVAAAIHHRRGIQRCITTTTVFSSSRIGDGWRNTCNIWILDHGWVKGRNSYVRILR